MFVENRGDFHCSFLHVSNGAMYNKYTGAFTFFIRRNFRGMSNRDFSCELNISPFLGSE